MKQKVNDRMQALDGTSEGAVKGWETRKGGGGGEEGAGGSGDQHMGKLQRALDGMTKMPYTISKDENMVSITMRPKTELPTGVSHGQGPAHYQRADEEKGIQDSLKKVEQWVQKNVQPEDVFIEGNTLTIISDKYAGPGVVTKVISKGKQNEQESSMNGIRHLMSKLVKKDTLDDRDMLVVPTILICEGVHNGALYTAEEIQKFPESWNGRPVVVRHPNKEGVPVTAGQPEVLESQTVGALYNCEWDAKSKKLKGEAWIDVDKCKAVAPEVLEKLEKDERLEVSTGLFTEDEELEVNEKWGEESYGTKVRNFRPDHLAILPDSVGACSWEDGAGMPRLNEQKDILSINEISHDQMRDAIHKKLNPPSPIPFPTMAMDSGKWIREMYDDHAIIGAGGKVYRQWFKKSKEGVELDGEPEEVVEERKYKPVKQNEDCSKYSEAQMKKMVKDGDMEQKDMDAELKKRKMKGNKSTKTTSSAIQQNSRKESSMDREEAVTQLIQGGKWNEQAREFLTNLEDETFQNIVALSTEVPKAEAPKAEVKAVEPKTNKEKVEAPKPQPVTLEQYVNGAPAEVRSVLNRAIARDQAVKNGLVKGLQGNARCKFNEAELKGMDIEALEKLAALAQVDVDYSASAGTAPKTNEADDDMSAPEMPVLFPKK